MRELDIVEFTKPWKDTEIKKQNGNMFHLYFSLPCSLFIQIQIKIPWFEYFCIWLLILYYPKSK